MKLLSEFRHAARRLGRAPGFAVTAALALGLGIGGNAALFTLVNAILIRPLPYPGADRLVTVGHAAPGMELAQAGQSDGTYLHYRAHNRVFDEIALYNENVVNVRGIDGAERVRVALVTRGFLPLLGATPARGRLLGEVDAGPRAPPTVVISHGLWTRQFGADPTIVGRTVELNSVPRLVVGVLEAGFDFPARETEVWYAQEFDAADARFSGLVYSAIARLSDGVTLDAAQADLQRLIPSLAGLYPDVTEETIRSAQLRAVVTPLADAVVGDARIALWVLLGAMGALLLVACANVANLLLVRAEHRQRELAVRTALGASRAHLAGFFLTESVILGLAGGALGLLLADASVRALVAFGPTEIPRLHEVRVDGVVIAFTAGLSLIAGLFFGAIPLLRHTRPDLGVALKGGPGRGDMGAERQRARRALVVAQLAITLTLLTGAGLMARSFWKLAHVDPGFDADGVLTMEIALPARPYPDFDAASRLWRDLLDRVRALPGVEAAGAVSDLPLTGEMIKRYLEQPLAIDGRATPAGELPVVGFKLVTPGYLEAMRIPVIEGRGIDQTLRAGDGMPVLVTAALARRFFTGGAIGARLGPARSRGRPPATWNTVIGIVGNVRDATLRSEAAASVYIPILDAPVLDTWSPSHMSIAIRTRGEPLALVPAVRDVLREIDPALPIANVRPMSDIVASSSARTSFTMLLLVIASVAALFLGAVGVYGVISYAVARRTHEMGVRIALGASPSDVVRLVGTQGARAALAGTVIGVVLSLAATRLLGGLLYEISPFDPLTFAGTAALLIAVAVVATWIPARRAASIAPMEALRSE